ncbi:MAG TPA: prepilin peptidase [Candidatus Baltobacteraceae bacterium]
MLSMPYQLMLVLAWTLVSAIVDRRNAKSEGVPRVGVWEALAVAVVAEAATLFGPRDEAFAMGLAIAGVGVAAYGDLQHRFIWQQIAVPTLIAVLAARYLTGTLTASLIGAALMAVLALLAYAAGQRWGKGAGMGFGDIAPIATVGAALGFLTAPLAMCLASLAFVIVALARRRPLDAALPFGPVIAGALVIGTLLR